MSRRGSIGSQLARLREDLDRIAHTGIVAEALWTGAKKREEIVALELEPNRRTGKVRPNAEILGLRLLDTVTFPALLRERRRVPPPGHGYCWECEGWTLAELLAFFAWCGEADPDIDELDDDLADRYRELLVGAVATWETDRVVAGVLAQRMADGMMADEALEGLASALAER